MDEPAALLAALLKSYARYYDITAEGTEPPFAAEAAFHSHDEQYFLVKRARLAEAEAHEYVFFALADTLTADNARRLDALAWERGTARAAPHAGHRSTDVALVVLARHIAPGAREYIQTCKHYKSYRFTFHGWSHYQLVALETTTGQTAANRRGRDLAGFLRNRYAKLLREEERMEK